MGFTERGYAGLSNDELVLAEWTRERAILIEGWYLQKCWYIKNLADLRDDKNCDVEKDSSALKPGSEFKKTELHAWKMIFALLGTKDTFLKQRINMIWHF